MFAETRLLACLTFLALAPARAIIAAPPGALSAVGLAPQRSRGELQLLAAEGDWQDSPERVVHHTKVRGGTHSVWQAASQATAAAPEKERYLEDTSHVARAVPGEERSPAGPEQPNSHVELARHLEVAAPAPAPALAPDSAQGEADQEHVAGVARRIKDKVRFAVRKKHVSVVSTSVECIVLLTCQYFFVYVTWFIVQVLNRLNLVKRENEERILIGVVETIFFVPMLCVLVFAVRMRAYQLAQGQAWKYELPQWWTRLGMLVCTWSVLIWTLVVLLARSIYGDAWEASAKTPGPLNLSKVLHMVRKCILVVTYVGFTTMCVGCLTMQGPKELWGEAGGPRVSPAVLCTMILTVMYFAVYLCLACMRLINQVAQRSADFKALPDSLVAAKTSLACVPMLCLLFIVARLRALQLDPVHGNPKTWVQGFFYVCTVCVIVQAVMFLLQSFGIGVTAPPASIKQGSLRMAEPSFHRVDKFDTMKMSLNVLVHVSLIPIFYGMYIQTRDDGKDVYFNPTLSKVVRLQAVYFSVHTLWLLVSIVTAHRDPAAGGPPTFLLRLEVFLRVRAKEAVAFCPMFCVLFLGLYIEAKQIGGAGFDPPRWCTRTEDAVTITIVCLAFAGIDAALPRVSPSVIRVCRIMQYLFLALLYLFALVLSVALCAMTGASDSPSTFQPVRASTPSNFA